ncbi:hypothetical protein CROQUDRAFT_94599 [Cronartium quercuum f. sp. fusiforme G11]|uniref:Multiple myeloma tumor-associated protein 2-like N-terminal domain-containing protein n=1 Tax=Cronartium quercuum f. sp. fusiforme G11 TaxID=708437 RepID=A0A9P6NFT9_9BASI|nr:hypothetical protein CROQUDRAFT_94599 [Cronartium quercuum f. sp. fusiforme G11]
MFSGPIRGGTRGGQGDFKWTDVADDKDRENYLGHSILAPVGRWQKNRDITWYNNEGKRTAEEQAEDERKRKQEEIKAIKAIEEEALSVALGFKPAAKGVGSSSNATALGDRPDTEADREAKASRKATEKAEKAARKAARAAKRAARHERHDTRDPRRSTTPKPHHTSRSPPRYRRNSRSPDRYREPDGRLEGERNGRHVRRERSRSEERGWDRGGTNRRRRREEDRPRSRSPPPPSRRPRSPSPRPHRPDEDQYHRYRSRR